MLQLRRLYTLRIAARWGAPGTCAIQQRRHVHMQPAAPPPRGWRRASGAARRLASSTAAARGGGRDDLLRHVDAEHRDDVARVLEQAERAAESWATVYTDFYPPPVVADAMAALDRMADVAGIPWGGYTQAERCRWSGAGLRGSRRGGAARRVEGCAAQLAKRARAMHALLYRIVARRAKDTASGTACLASVCTPSQAPHPYPTPAQPPRCCPDAGLFWGARRRWKPLKATHSSWAAWRRCSARATFVSGHGPAAGAAAIRRLHHILDTCGRCKFPP